MTLNDWAPHPYSPAFFGLDRTVPPVRLHRRTRSAMKKLREVLRKWLVKDGAFVRVK